MKMNPLKHSVTIILATIFLLLTYNLKAEYTQTCSVRYMTKDGWSKKYTVEVNFLTDSELNSATKSFSYSAYSVYAVIFWRQNQASVIKLSNFLMCGSLVTQNCITNVIGDLKGNDQDDDE